MFCRYCKETTHKIEDCSKIICRQCGVYGHHQKKCNAVFCNRCSKIHEIRECICEFCKSPKHADTDCLKTFSDVWRIIRQIEKFIEIIMQSDKEYCSHAIELEKLIIEIQDLKLKDILFNGYTNIIGNIYDRACEIYTSFYTKKWKITPGKVINEWECDILKVVFQGGHGHSVDGSGISHAIVSEENYSRLKMNQIHLEACLVFPSKYNISETPRTEIWGN